jgi:hypothetical protein
MVIARAIVANRDTVILGLSRLNTERLLDNQPIRIQGADLGLPGINIIILAGDTEQSMLEDLRSIGVTLP